MNLGGGGGGGYQRSQGGWSLTRYLQSRTVRSDSVTQVMAVPATGAATKAMAAEATAAASKVPTTRTKAATTRTSSIKAVAASSGRRFLRYHQDLSELEKYSGLVLIGFRSFLRH